MLVVDTENCITVHLSQLHSLQGEVSVYVVGVLLAQEALRKAY